MYEISSVFMCSVCACSIFPSGLSADASKKLLSSPLAASAGASLLSLDQRKLKTMGISQAADVLLLLGMIAGIGCIIQVELLLKLFKQFSLSAVSICIRFQSISSHDQS